MQTQSTAAERKCDVVTKTLDSVTKNEMVSFTGKLMELDIIMLSEISKV